MRIEEIQALMADEMAQVDACIRQQTYSDVVLVRNVAEYIISAGGKRLRPLVVLLSAQLQARNPEGRHTLAAIVEFIHTATLLHDDVVDESDRRRGRNTANAVFGNAASVLVGDFLYSRAFQMMVSLDSMQVMQELSNTTNQIAEGEVLQLMHVGNPDTSEPHYFEVIRNKTAVLFASACKLGGFLGNLSPTQQEALYGYGLQLGTAFQLADDCLDFDGDADQLGKNVGDDLAEGKPTLPLIYAMTNCSAEDRAFLKSAIRDGDIEHLPRVLDLIQTTDALSYTRRKAEQAVASAEKYLQEFEDSPQRRALNGLAQFAIERSQ